MQASETHVLRHMVTTCQDALTQLHVQENKLGQKFVVDATLMADLATAGQTDDLHHTVNYAQVYE